MTITFTKIPRNSMSLLFLAWLMPAGLFAATAPAKSMAAVPKPAASSAPKSTTSTAIKTSAVTTTKPAYVSAPAAKPAAVMTKVAPPVTITSKTSSPTMANSTPAYLNLTAPRLSPAEKSVAIARIVTKVATISKLESIVGFSNAQIKQVGIAGKVAGVIGLAGNAIEENGGLKNTINGIKNAPSNAAWMVTQTSTDQKLAFATDATNKVTAVALKSAASPVLAAVSLVTGKQVPLTGQMVGNAAKVLAQAARSVPIRSQLVGPGFASGSSAKSAR